MFGRRFFGGSYYGPRYFGDGGLGVPVNPATILEPIPGAGSGKNRKNWKKLQAKELKRVLGELEELPETAYAVATIKAAHAKPPKPRKPGQPFVHQELQVDYAALAANIDAVRWLLNAYRELQEGIARERLIQAGIYERLLDDDEDAFMLLM